MRSILVFMTAAGLLFSVGCAKQSFLGKTAANEGQTKIPTPDERPKCEIDAVDYVLKTHIMSFQLTDKGGVNFGFNLFSGFLNALGLNLQIESGQIDAAMEVFEPLKPHISVVDVTGKARSNSVDFRFQLDAIKLKADINYFHQTPLAGLSEKTLKNTFEKVARSLEQVETDWSTRVLNVPSSDQVVVPVGTVAGLEIGDEFKIFNVEHTWAGEPCKSEYLMARKTTQEPIAHAVVTQVAKNAAALTLAKHLSDQDQVVEPGAIVEIQKLVASPGQKKREPLARSLRIGEITSEKLMIKDIGEVDLRRYMDHQIRSVVTKHKYYLRD